MGSYSQEELCVAKPQWNVQPFVEGRLGGFPVNARPMGAITNVALRAPTSAQRRVPRPIGMLLSSQEATTAQTVPLREVGNHLLMWVMNAALENSVGEREALEWLSDAVQCLRLFGRSMTHGLEWLSSVEAEPERLEAVLLEACRNTDTTCPLASALMGHVRRCLALLEVSRP